MISDIFSQATEVVDVVVIEGVTEEDGSMVEVVEEDGILETITVTMEVRGTNNMTL